MIQMLDLLKPAFGLVSTFMKNRREKSAAKQKLKLAVIENKARLASDTQSNNHAWEMASLENSDVWLKRVSFFLFTAPIVLTMVGSFFGWEAKVEAMWKSFDQVPDWWAYIYFAMTGGIWGVAALRDKGVLGGK